MKATITSTTATDQQDVGLEGADIELYDIWDGASIDLQIYSLNGEWKTIATYTTDTFDVNIASKHNREFRFKASEVGASTSVKVAIGTAA